MSKEEQLAKIVEYIEKAGLTFTEPFSLISATVVEASFYTGISKNVILVHINKTFKKKYGEKYIKAQMIAHNIADGKNSNEERIMAKDFSNEIEKVKEQKAPKERKKYEYNKDKSEYVKRKPTTVLGVAYKDYTGLTMKDNVRLYSSCHSYYKRHKQFLWEVPDKWRKACKKYGFEDKKLANEQECSVNTN